MRRYGPNFFKVIKHPPQIAYALGLGFLIGRFVLLLTSTGRKTGRPHTIPLQYEAIQGQFCIASVKGLQADWVRNIQANPMVELRVKHQHIPGQAEVIVAVDQIADFIAYRIAKHPLMIKTIMRLDGLPMAMTRQELEEYARGLALVRVDPRRSL